MNHLYTVRGKLPSSTFRRIPCSDLLPRLVFQRLPNGPPNALWLRTLGDPASCVPPIGPIHDKVHVMPIQYKPKLWYRSGPPDRFRVIGGAVAEGSSSVVDKWYKVHIEATGLSIPGPMLSWDCPILGTR